MEITEEELAEAAGWKAWKQGRELHKRREATDIVRSGSLFTGVMKIGGRVARPKVKWLSKTDIVTSCGCLENRQTGGLCAHGVAVVLGGIAVPEPVAVEQAMQPEVPERDLVTLLFPPIYAKLLHAGKAIPVRWEKASAGIPSRVIGLPESVSQNAGMAQLENARLLELFTIAKNVNNSLWLDQKGEVTPVVVSDIVPRFQANAANKSGYTHFTISVKNNGKSFVFINKNDFHALLSKDAVNKVLISPELGRFMQRSSFGDLLEGQTLTVNIEDFVREVDFWDQLCDFGDDLDAVGLKIEDAQIRARVELKGGSRKLVAQVFTEWVDESGQVLVGAKIGGLMADPEDGMHWYRVMPGTVAAGDRLQEMGFSKSSGVTYELSGENPVMEFLAHDLPVLETEAEVDMVPGIEAYRGMLAPLKPEVEVGESSGEDWIGFDLGYRAPGSERLTLDQVRKLLGSGRKTVKMKSGQTAVLSSRDLKLVEEVLKDVDPDQSDGGYRTNAAQAQYLQSLAGECGIGFVGNAGEVTEWDLEEAIPDLAGILRNYQADGVRFILQSVERSGAALLADDMGLGKTLQSLSVMAALRASGEEGPFLVVGPTSLIGTWVGEVEKFLPHWNILPWHGAKRAERVAKIDQVDVVVTSFALVARDLKELQKHTWAGVFVDEASIIRNADTQAAKALCALQSPVRIALTGTPIENGVGDIWSIFRFLVPNYLGRRDDFKQRYEKPMSQGVADASMIARLRSRLTPFMLRRVKSDVAKDLPAKIMCVRECGMTSAQSDVYHSLLKDGQQVLEEFSEKAGRNAARMQVLTLLLRLRQAASEPRLLGAETDPSGKMEHLSELLTEALAGGHKVLVFSQFTSMLDLIAQSLDEQDIEYCHLTGATRDRAAEVARFQRKDGPAVFLISLKAGGYGLTLTEADTVIHCDPWWNPAVEAQATDRAHRIGQTRPVTVYKLITKGTVEEKILALQEKKQNILDSAFDEQTPQMKGLTDDDLMDVLGV